MSSLNPSLLNNRSSSESSSTHFQSANASVAATRLAGQHAHPSHLSHHSGLESHEYLFTSESVSEGHPDKVADQISDAVLDAILEQDPLARVAAETLCNTGLVVLAGEISTTAKVDYQKIVRDTLIHIGYTDSSFGMDAKTAEVLVKYDQQSPDIAQGVNEGSGVDLQQGAGDQGLMFGYATDETDNLMPTAIEFANRLMKQQAHLRHSNALPWLRPDAKSQVTLRYESGVPVGIHTIVLSTQHAPEISQEEIHHEVIEKIIKAVLPEEWLLNTKYLINPTGRFVIGGPQGDCGLTGRKIIVDTYGGACPHGGGAFSGKDPSKVDRSAAYAARYIAKNIVAAGLAKKCRVQLSYAIGISEPINITVHTEGTGLFPDHLLAKWVEQTFDLRPKGIIQMLDLLRPIYTKTAAYGHFGQDGFSWEKTDKVQELQRLSHL